MQGNGRKKPIDHWETLEILHSDSKNVGRDDLGIVIEVQRPVFEDERTGRVSLGIAVKRGERMLRLFSRDGDLSELEALGAILATVEPKLDDIRKRYREVESQHRPPPRQPRQDNRGGGGDFDYGKVGGGLSRFSETSKRERKRQKHRERERGQHTD